VGSSGVEPHWNVELVCRSSPRHVPTTFQSWLRHLMCCTYSGYGHFGAYVPLYVPFSGLGRFPLSGLSPTVTTIMLRHLVGLPLRHGQDRPAPELEDVASSRKGWSPWTTRRRSGDERGTEMAQTAYYTVKSRLGPWRTGEIPGKSTINSR